jgi:pantoate kinase
VVRERRFTGERWARAWAPGHLTGIFSPQPDARDPRARGSVGAGLVLEAGVVAAVHWNPGGPRRFQLSGNGSATFPISREVVNRLWSVREGSLSVRLHHDLPIGQGFGMSAAGALATALGVAAVLSVPRSRAIQIAHLADLYGGGGLGGVAAILGGGLEVRRRPGVPPYGTVVHRLLSKSIFVGVMGDPLPSPRLLRSDRFLSRLRSAAAPSLDRVLRNPRWSVFWEESERFTDRLRIFPPPLGRLIHALRNSGCPCAQAMFGRAFFAAPNNEATRRSLLRVTRQRSVEVRSIPLARFGARSHLVARSRVPAE